MAFIRCMRKMSRLRTFMIMGCVWIGLAAFGLIIDPEKKLVILSLFIFGIVYLAYFWLLKRLPVLELFDEELLVHKKLCDRKKIRVDQIVHVEQNPKDIILHMKDNQNVVIQRSTVQSQEVRVFLETLQNKMSKT